MVVTTGHQQFDGNPNAIGILSTAYHLKTTNYLDKSG